MKHNKLFGFLLLFLIIAILAGGVIFFARNAKVDPFTASVSGENSAKMLWSFEYVQNDRPRVVSFFVILDGPTKQIGVLEIPSNLALYDTAASTYVPADLYFTDGGYKEYRKALASALQSEDFTYVFMNESMLADFIDLMGGVQLFIVEEEETLAQDTAQSTLAGSVNLDGSDIGAYVNSMENQSGDLLAVSSRRKEFITALLRKFQLNAETLTNKKTGKRFLSLVHTSLTKESLRALSGIIPTYAVERLFYQRINGVTRTVRVGDADRSMLFINSEVGSLPEIVDFFQRQIRNSSTRGGQSDVTLTILNGTVINGLARRARDLYEAAGFTVLSVGNAASTDVKQTAVIDRTGNKVFATAVATVINARSVITDISAVDAAGASITLILGEDFDGERVTQ